MQLHFDHDAKKYVIPNASELMLNIWTYLKYELPESEKKNISDIINYLIGINDLTKIICDYVDCKINLKLYLWNCIDSCNALFAYSFDNEDHVGTKIDIKNYMCYRIYTTDSNNQLKEFIIDGDKNYLQQYKQDIEQENEIMDELYKSLIKDHRSYKRVRQESNNIVDT